MSMKQVIYDIFSQEAVHRMNTILYTDSCSKLPEAIYRHTDLDYLCIPTDEGCFLKPTFRNMPYINSFVPEIDVAISQNNGQTTLKLIGRPVKSVRIFMGVWFGFALMMELLLLIAAVTSGLDITFHVFIPAFMCVFGYCLCNITTKRTFNAVLKAIQKEYP